MEPSSNKNYVGQPESREWMHVGHVVVRSSHDFDAEEHQLDPRYDLADHSLTGFGWNYSGSGPAQLALAMLADASGDDAAALKHYQAFKAERIAALPRGPWKITATDVLLWLAERGTG